MSLSDASSLATLVGLVVAIAGLWLVVLQLFASTRTERAQTTIMFQDRFKESSDARGYVLAMFPLHTSLRDVFGDNFDLFPTWDKLEDLSDDDRRAAMAVVNALNDVAQYVVDGLEMRSALQQYHTIFVRAGALLEPLILQLNEVENGEMKARIGRRIPVLYNAAIAYHRANPIHRGRSIILTRRLPDGSTVATTLLDAEGRGLTQFPRFPDSPDESLLIPERSVRGTVRHAEKILRRY